jgi:hypothetical protein|tara:strand:+ start:801 stop:1184 length:384 start_codon:yes stop_codon:yes gene_type:complete
LQDLTNQNEHPTLTKKVLFSLKKAIRLSWLGLETLKCLLKKTNLLGVKVSEQDISAILQKINSVPDIGHVRRGEMTIKELLVLQQKHEEECNLRYSRIEKTLDKLDMRMWGIAVLIVGAAIVGEFLI